MQKRKTPHRGEVWLFDLGKAGKVRPRLRGSRYEIGVNVAFLKPGAFLDRTPPTYPNLRAIRKFGTLSSQQFDLVFQGCFAGSALRVNGIGKTERPRVG
jgi:hypothetical protein